MPNLDTPITTTVTEAMHFQRGLHYLIVKVCLIFIIVTLFDWDIAHEKENVPKNTIVH